MTGSLRIAPLLATRGLVALSVFADDDDLQRPARGVVLCDGDVTLAVDLHDDAARRELSFWLRRHEVVGLFDSARPQQRRLLQSDVDVARPLCLHTLARLSSQKSEERLRFPRSIEDAKRRALDAFARLPELLDATERAGHRKVARLENLVLRPFAALENRGLPIDVDGWRALVDMARERALLARGEVFASLGGIVARDLFGEPDLNLDSDLELRAVLSRLVGHELDDVGRHTLQGLGHPVGEHLVAYREAAKIVSTYGDAFLGQVGRDGRVRATFVPLGASTGRVASRDPNLQNLPGGEAFHRCVRPGEGRAVVTADYATCELRILAELSGDEMFRNAFERDLDLHSVVATEMFGVPVSKDQNAELRQRAKAINFGLVYGMGAAALGSQVGAAGPEAQALLDRYFERFPKIRGYLEGSVDDALARGYAETVLGRRLVFDQETLALDNARGELSRIAKNMPIQGTSADMTKLAMVRVHERLLAEFGDAGLINTVHDELVVECRAHDAERVARAVGEEMSAAHITLLRHVPPKVEVTAAPHWQH